MRVTIDGITYEGTPSEIRDIVENPPKERVQQTSDRTDCPDNDRWNYPRWTETDQRYPWPDSVPSPFTWWDSPGTQRNWDGSPRVTCCASVVH